MSLIVSRLLLQQIERHLQMNCDYREAERIGQTESILDLAHQLQRNFRAFDVCISWHMQYLVDPPIPEVPKD